MPIYPNFISKAVTSPPPGRLVPQIPFHSLQRGRTKELKKTIEGRLPYSHYKQCSSKCDVDEAHSIDGSYRKTYGWSEPVLRRGEAVFQLVLGNEDKYRGTGVTSYDALVHLQSNLQNGNKYVNP